MKIVVLIKLCLKPITQFIQVTIWCVLCSEWYEARRCFTVIAFKVCLWNIPLGCSKKTRTKWNLMGHIRF